MRCGKCGKNFKEGKHNGICPRCGHFNKGQTEYDVSKYINAKFDEEDRTYAGARPWGSGTYRTDAYGQKKPCRAWRTGARGQSGAYGYYGQARVYGEKEKNIVTPICVVIAILAIVGTVIGCQLKRQSLEKIFYTLEFEQEEVQPGELFEINGQLVVVGGAKVVDTSMLDGMPKGEKLVAVSVEILSPKEHKSADVPSSVYVWDGSFYKLPPSDFTIKDVIYGGDRPEGKEILDRYSFYGYVPKDGRKGECYFFVEEDAEKISIFFEEGSEADGIYLLQRRVSIPLRLEEDRI